MMTSVIELEFDLISADMSIDMEMAEETEVIEFGINSGDGLKPYTGDYDVIPKVVDQVLETKNLSMTDDVTVKEIPMHEVSNDYGTTIIIGGIL
jgi:hypothetical protein